MASEPGSDRTNGNAASGRELTRRDLMGAGLVVGAGLVAVSFPIMRYLSPAAAGEEARRAEIPVDRLGLWEAERVLVGGRPGFVVRTPDELYACSGVCTHLGCVVNWQRSRRVFFCPCHGGRFAPDGRVLGGPPPAPLARFEVSVRRGKIVVEPA